MLKEEKYNIGLYLIFSVIVSLFAVTIWIRRPNYILLSLLILFIFIIILSLSREHILLYLFAAFFWLSRSVYFDPLSPVDFLSGAEEVEILVYIAFFAWITKYAMIGKLKEGLKSILTTPFLLPLILYSFGGINAFLIGKYPEKDIAAILVRKNCFYGILIYFLCSKFIKNTSQFGRFMIAMLVGGCIVGGRYLYLFQYNPSALYGTREALRLGGKITFVSSILNINALGIGTYLATLIPLSAALFLLGGSRFKKYAGLLVFCLFSYLLILTGSRSCLIGAIIGIVMVIILGKKYSKLYSMKVILFLSLIIIGYLLMVSHALLSEFLTTRIESLQYISKDISLLTRFKIWRGSLNLLFSNPLGMSFWRFYNFGFGSIKTTPHNLFLAIGLTNGFIGLFGFIWFVFAWFKKMIGFLKFNHSENKIFHIGAIAGMVSFLFSGLFDSYNFIFLNISQMWAIFGATVFVLDRNKIDVYEKS